MDWQKVIAELCSAGLSQAQIAKACEAGQSTVSELLGGKTAEPRHGLGEKLLVLHRKHASKGTTAKGLNTAGVLRGR